MKEFKPRDKLTQRMTRDGAVLDNQTTGAEIHISERDAEKQLSPDRQPVQMGKRDAPMNPAEDAPKHGRQLRPQEQKEPEKEQPNPQPGDLVFFVGTYDTPGVSHVGIYVGNSMMIHCGDPISYSNLNSSYWQAHFYAYARPPYN